MFKQFLILLVINFAGVIIQNLFHLPLPGTILGMLILFILLWTKVLKVESVEKVCDFLILNMIIFFLPPAVELLEYMTLLKTGFFKILILLIVTTVITMVVTGKTVEYCIKKMEKK
ncbi:CidA/LrgA family protein [Fusobacterium perfoetens]|uniref:CidA/LrgA family protein n=1 Tax=Fusobacterium perfoetens TaxID=852 RepID=UPI001F32FDB9|nr:CidA/LrgA family protein [Fusobacterium perfoetens]MCF2624909.1 CidA/LrgA family protein [Fusobacterium perfoetens]